MGRISVTVSVVRQWNEYEIVKYINENSFIEILASSKYSMWEQRGKQM